MKQHLFKTTLLALAGTGILSSSVLAQSSTTYAQGDLLLGFRAAPMSTGAASNVLVDLGNGSVAAVDAAAISGTPLTFNISNLFSTLNAVYGSNWTTRSDLFFSVAGANATTNSTIYITAPEVVGNGEATPWNGLGGSLQTGVRNKINTEGGIPNTAGYNFYILNTNPNGAGAAVIEGQSDTNSYGSYMPGGTTANAGPAPGISYAEFNPTIEGTFANGTSGITLDLIKLTSATGANPGQDLGDFTINDSGLLTFTPDISEVPEPSTFIAPLLAAAAVAVLAVRRRRQIAQH
jgi:hypothetical protein